MKKTSPFMTDENNVINAFEVDGKELAFGLTQMVKCVPPKPSLPILDSVNIRSKDDGRVVLVGTNFEHTVMFSPDSGYATPGLDICINARKLQGIAKRAGSNTVRMTATYNGDVLDSLVVEYGKKKLVQTGHQLRLASEFPGQAVMPPKDFTHNIKTGRLNLLLGLERTIPAAATAYDRPALRGIMLTSQDYFGWLTMVATNGFILAEQNIDYGDDIGNDPIPPYILELDTAKTVLSIMKAEKEFSEVLIKYGSTTFDKTFMVISLGRFSIITSCESGLRFPDYKPVMNGEFEKMTVSSPNLIQLTAAMVDAKNHTGNGGATLHVSEALVVTADNVEDGQDVTYVDHNCNGDDLTFSVNPGYMLDLIKPLKGENLEMVFNYVAGGYDHTPMYIEAPKYRAAIMPMHLGR